MNPIVNTEHDGKFVAYLSTRNLYHVLPAAYNSLLAHTQVDHVYLLVEDDALPYALPEKVSCVNVSGQEFFPHDGPNYNSKYSYMALMKAALAKIFPDAGRILVLDVDTIVNDDISILWNVDMTDAYFAAVKEPRMSQFKGYTYLNFGVVMLNLDLLRDVNMDDEIIAELNSRYRTYPEQDTFNLLCTWHFVEFPPDYNVTRGGMNITGQPQREIITHYAGYRDWSGFELVQYWMTHTEPPKKHKNVVYMGNRKYYGMMVTAAKSLLCHTPVDCIYLLTEDNELPTGLPPVFRIINVSRQEIFRPDGPNVNGYYSYMTLMRAALTKLLPDQDCVLLLDPDTIVSEDISPLWDYDISQYYFAAVQEVRNHNHTKNPYYNAGVMLMNLRKFRQTGMDDRIIHEINTVPYKHMEQDVLNFLCDPYILPLPSCYSSSFVSEPCENPRISHYLSYAKPQLPEAQKPYVNLTWDQVPYANGGENT